MIAVMRECSPNALVQSVRDLIGRQGHFDLNRPFGAAAPEDTDAVLSPVIQLRDSEKRSAGASTNISSALASDSEMTWGGGSAMGMV